MDFKIRHSREAIASDIALARVFLFEEDGMPVGTGTLDGCHVARVFVLSDHQGAGCGTAIMDALEGLASASYGTVMLDSSAPAEQFYRNRGYQDVSEGVWEIESRGALPAATLTYKIMEKRHG